MAKIGCGVSHEDT